MQIFSRVQIEDNTKLLADAMGKIKLASFNNLIQVNTFHVKCAEVIMNNH